MKTALLAGATGMVGTQLLQQLVDHPEYKHIHVLTRKPLKILSKKIIEYQINFDALNELNPDIPADHVYCSLGTTIKKAKTREKFRKVDYDYVIALAKKAIEIKALKFLVVSSLGANPNSNIFYNRVKGQTEETLKELNLSNLFIFRPSLLLGDREEFRGGEKIATVAFNIFSFVMAGRLKKYKGVEAGQVAKAMIHTALNNEETLKTIESDTIQCF